MTAICSYKPQETPAVTDIPFQANQRVRIMKGPLQGLEGLFVADSNKRVYALLEIMGKSVKVPLKSIAAA